MAKNPEILYKLEGMQKEKGYLYYLMNVDGCVCVCRSKVTHHGKG